VLIGIHAMGRSQNRWWQAEFNGRPPLEQTDKITRLALNKGYAVVITDACQQIIGPNSNPGYKPKPGIHTYTQSDVYGQQRRSFKYNGY
jgi:hypothetical protein